MILLKCLLGTLESLTYPILNYLNGGYLGLNGLIFSQPSIVDGLNREIGLWFPAGGKAHAYNLMGAKLSKLKLEGFDFNESETPELIEDEGMLKLVWNDQIVLYLIHYLILCHL